MRYVMNGDNDSLTGGINFMLVHLAGGFRFIFIFSSESIRSWFSGECDKIVAVLRNSHKLFHLIVRAPHDTFLAPCIREFHFLVVVFVRRFRAYERTIYQIGWAWAGLLRSFVYSVVQHFRCHPATDRKCMRIQYGN